MRKRSLDARTERYRTGLLLVPQAGAARCFGRDWTAVPVLGSKTRIFLRLGFIDIRACQYLFTSVDGKIGKSITYCQMANGITVIS